MPSTPNLGLTHIETAQAQKEVTANAAFDALDTAMNDTVDVACGAGGTITVSLADFTANDMLRLTGSPSAAFTLSLPGTKRSFSIRNATGRQATVTTATSGGVLTCAVGPGEAARLYSNGVDVRKTGTNEQGIAFAISGEPTSGDIVEAVALTAFTIPANAVLSQATARSGTGSWEEPIIFNLQVNGSNVATITFPAASATGAFTMASPADVPAGGRVGIVNPTLGSPTTELRHVAISIWGAAS